MGTVTTRLATEARTIFSDLGYTVSDDGHEIRAERKWRTVHVTPMPDPTDLPQGGELRCFVTWAEQTRELRRELTSQTLPYEWAIIGVSRDGGYEVDASTVRV